MLDLETWGTNLGCDIRSIGAVVFDPLTGEIGNDFYVATLDGRSFGLTRDSSTEKWWNEQDSLAQNAFDNGKPLEDALEMFSSWFNDNAEHGEILSLWCNGPHFDEVILKHVYNVVGKTHPWHYRAPRDFRTIMEAAGWPEIPFDGVAHNALDDAKHQARCVIVAYASLSK